MQAEEEWKSNIKWILRGSKRKPSESTQELELWHARYNKAKARSMEQGISSALLRLGGAHDVDEDNLHQILRRIHDGLLIVIQVRSLRQEQPTSHVVEVSASATDHLC